MEIVRVPSSGFYPAVATAIAEDLRSEIQYSESAQLSVSGGRSPVALFNELSRRPLPWEKIGIHLVDDRLVGIDHPLSNAALVQTHLLKDKAANARLHPLASAVGTHPPASTVTVLGMGSDGHTASIFPGAKNLVELTNPTGDASVLELDIDLEKLPSDARVARVTTTTAFILKSKKILLPVVGEDKQALLFKLLEAGRVDDQHPITSVLFANHPGLSLWIQQ